jgi:hypothetical protein
MAILVAGLCLIAAAVVAAFGLRNDHRHKPDTAESELHHPPTSASPL